jgi:cell division protein ZipA
MDADVLRLILLILGGALILGIYLWDRHKRVNARIHAIHRLQQRHRMEPTLGDLKEARDAPPDPSVLGEPPEPAEPPRPAPWRRAPDRLRRALRRRLTPADEGPVPSVARREEPSAGERAPGDERESRPEVPGMILQVNIAARHGPFAGSHILRAIDAVAMKPGPMRIFHRHHGPGPAGPVLFSMASMVEPGVFPLDAMEGFSTPGLTLFAQLPGPQDGLAVFSDMLFTAERLAAELDGELQDETHSRLTKQTIEHIRSQILEHRRRVQLARSRKR